MMDNVSRLIGNATTMTTVMTIAMKEAIAGRKVASVAPFITKDQMHMHYIYI